MDIQVMLNVKKIKTGMSNFSNALHFYSRNFSFKIKKNNNAINGFQFEDTHKEIKYLQYADDITLTLKKHLNSKKGITDCGIICIRNLKDKHEIIEGVKVTNSAVRCLGIHIGHDKNRFEVKLDENLQRHGKTF